MLAFGASGTFWRYWGVKQSIGQRKQEPRAYNAEHRSAGYPAVPTALMLAMQ